MRLIHKGQSLGQPVPTIGANGNWFIEGQDTGIKADATKIDRGTLTGDISVLDTAIEPGIYNWIDHAGEFGEFTGGLWNIKVEASVYGISPSIVQIATSTYHAFFAGIVKVRSKYYANDNNGSQWSPWITLANTTQTSNPNLIKNWYFQKGVTLNQRGKDEYSWNGTGDTHFIDGWRFTSIAYVSGDLYGGYLTDNGLKLPPHGGYSSSHVNYSFEDSIFKALRGKQVTFSILLSSGKFGSKTVTVALEGSEATMQQNWLQINSTLSCGLYSWAEYDHGRLCFMVDNINNSQNTVRAVKLEIGDHQTLCRQDINGNWVLNDPPPDPGELLSWGQRYLTPLPVPVHLNGWFNNSMTSLHIPYPLIDRMREGVNPVVIFKNGTTFANWAATVYIDCAGKRFSPNSNYWTGLSAEKSSSKMILAVSSVGTTTLSECKSNTAGVWSSNNTPIFLSSEL